MGNGHRIDRRQRHARRPKERVAVDLVLEERVAGPAGLDDARQVRQGGDERLDLFGGRPRGRHDGDKRRVAGVKARVFSPRAHEAAGDERATHDQYESERQFDGDKPRLPPEAGRCAATLTHWRAEAGVRDRPRGEQRHEHRAPGGPESGERQDAQIDRGCLQNRHEARQE
jgi:hypothetical protein